jgi:hypothetical protein
MRSAKVTRLGLIFEGALSQHTIDMGHTLLFLALQATHFFLPLFPHGLFAVFLALQINGIIKSELYRTLPPPPDRDDDFFRGT